MRVMKIHSPEEFALDNSNLEDAEKFQLDRLTAAATFENKLSKIGNIRWCFCPEIGRDFHLSADVDHLYITIKAFPSDHYLGHKASKKYPNIAKDISSGYLTCDLIMFLPDYSGNNTSGELSSTEHIFCGETAIDDAMRMFQHLSKPKNVVDEDEYSYEFKV